MEKMKIKNSLLWRRKIKLGRRPDHRQDLSGLELASEIISQKRTLVGDLRKNGKETESIREGSGRLFKRMSFKSLALDGRADSARQAGRLPFFLFKECTIMQN